MSEEENDYLKELIISTVKRNDAINEMRTSFCQSMDSLNNHLDKEAGKSLDQLDGIAKSLEQLVDIFKAYLKPKKK